MKKSVEVKKEYEEAFDLFLLGNKIKICNFIYLSCGTKFWELEVSKEDVEKIQVLPYVTYFKDTLFFSPS